MIRLRHAQLDPSVSYAVASFFFVGLPWQTLSMKKPRFSPGLGQWAFSDAYPSNDPLTSIAEGRKHRVPSSRLVRRYLYGGGLTDLECFLSRITFSFSCGDLGRRVPCHRFWRSRDSRYVDDLLRGGQPSCGGLRLTGAARVKAASGARAGRFALGQGAGEIGSASSTRPVGSTGSQVKELICNGMGV